MKRKIVDWIKNYCSEKKFKLVVGVSGGIDSALVSTLCAMTEIETILVSMPIYQNELELTRARKHINWLKNKYNNVVEKEYDLTNIYDVFLKKFANEYNNNLAFANTRSRLRMITLYQIATSVNGIVVGTGNKIEDFGIGFFTKYGDGGVDISPIADLTKTEVRKMAKIIGVPEYIVTAKPTDGLWEDNRTDEDQIGASYEELEWAMEFEGTHSDLTERQHQILNIYNKFNTQNKHKMLSIPIFKK